MSPDDLISQLARRSDALHRLGVRELALFGSHARGEAGDHSDVDLLLDLETRSFDAYMDTKFMLEDALQRPVDLVLKDRLKPALRERVLAEAVHVPGF